MNINYNPIFIFPEFNLIKNNSIFFKFLILFQIAAIIVVIVIFYPMEVIFLYNLIMGNYEISNLEKENMNKFKLSVDNLSSAILSCDSLNNLVINGTIKALDINKNFITCTTQIKELYGIV